MDHPKYMKLQLYNEQNYIKGFICSSFLLFLVSVSNVEHCRAILSAQ